MQDMDKNHTIFRLASALLALSVKVRKMWSFIFWYAFFIFSRLVFFLLLPLPVSAPFFSYPIVFMLL
jgi:hypothetical protein